MINIRLFGTGRVRSDDGGGVDRRSLGVQHWRILQLLAVHRTLSKSALAELLWEGDVPAGHVATLESYMSVLRRRLDAGATASTSVVLTRPGGYRLDESRVTVDLWLFDDLLDRAEGLPAERALPLFERALGLAGQLPLAEEAKLRWAAEIRERYRVRVVAAATTAARHALAIGAAARAHEHAALATDLDPLAEDAWRIRMSALHASGDRAGALRCFHACRQILADELGIEPAPATDDLFVRILQGCKRDADDMTGVVRAVLAAAQELAAGDGTADVPVVQLLARTEVLARRLAPLAIAG